MREPHTPPFPVRVIEKGKSRLAHLNLLSTLLTALAVASMSKLRSPRASETFQLTHSLKLKDRLLIK